MLDLYGAHQAGRPLKRSHALVNFVMVAHLRHLYRYAGPDRESQRLLLRYVTPLLGTRILLPDSDGQGKDSVDR